MLKFKQINGADRALELLCSIPPEPGSVALVDLASDFGGNDKIRNLIVKLRGRGYPVRVYQHNGYRVAIEQEHWPKARRAAEAYWRRVHGR